MPTAFVPAESAEPASQPEPTTAQLLAGIVTDVQRLIEQQLDLARREIENDLQRAARAGVVLAAGIAMLFVSLAEFSASAAYGLYVWSNPTVDPTTFPLWACHALVGIAFFVAGVLCTLLGRSMFRRMKPLHQAAAAAEETLEWATNQK